MREIANQVVHIIRSAYRYWRFSGNCYGCYRGIFETEQAAIASAPKGRKIGYNHSELAKEYQANLYKTIGFYDYPIVFWLKDLLTEGCTVFDFGGNVGTHFYGYEGYLNYPKNLRWMVCELPALAQAGEELARRENRSELVFTTNFEDANGADIFIGSGSIQYVDFLTAAIAKLSEKPKHILINRLPLCEGKSFITLQNGGMVFYPVHVFNRVQFIDSIAAIGYELVDSWKDRSEPCAVPFHPEFRSLFFNGLYFKAI